MLYIDTQYGRGIYRLRLENMYVVTDAGTVQRSCRLSGILEQARLKRQQH